MYIGHFDKKYNISSINSTILIKKWQKNLIKINSFVYAYFQN